MEKILVLGANGMVGSAIVRALIAKRHDPRSIFLLDRQDTDLSSQRSTMEIINHYHPTQVYLAAAKVGGIHANNTYPAEFIRDNLVIATNVIHAAHEADVPQLLFLGSSCIYPRDAAQPMREDALLTGPLEPTNEPYAIAKIAGIKLCESYRRQYGRDYRSVMPTNLFGPNDNYHPENSHVVPALLRRFHEAREQNAPEVVVWGTGTPKREFLHVDDMAEACVHVMDLPEDVYWGAVPPMQSHINIGTGQDCSIRELAETIARVTGYEGRLTFDTSQPDGMPRKLLDTALIESLGWSPRIPLEEGLRDAYRWFVEREADRRTA